MWVFVVLNYFFLTHRKICRLSLFYRFQRHWRQLRDVIDTGEQFTINSKALKTLKICMCLFGWWKNHRTEKSHGTLPVNILILVVKKLVTISNCWFSRWPTFFLTKLSVAGRIVTVIPQPLTLLLSKTLKISQNQQEWIKKSTLVCCRWNWLPSVSLHSLNCYLLHSPLSADTAINASSYCLPVSWHSHNCCLLYSPLSADIVIIAASFILICKLTQP